MCVNGVKCTGSQTTLYFSLSQLCTTEKDVLITSLLGDDTKVFLFYKKGGGGGTLYDDKFITANKVDKTHKAWGKKPHRQYSHVVLGMDIYSNLS